jgi:hypothetical protein
MWDKYFFDHFLIRLSKSKENMNFILKGGFLLENIVGIKNRTTLDLDFSYRLEDINEEEVKNKIINILNIEVDDDIDYDFLDISPITEDKGGRSGYRVRLNVTTGNIKKIFGIDIVCGDVITPNAIKTTYTTNITEEEFKMYKVGSKYEFVTEVNLAEQLSNQTPEPTQPTNPNAFDPTLINPLERFLPVSNFTLTSDSIIELSVLFGEKFEAFDLDIKVKGSGSEEFFGVTTTSSVELEMGLKLNLKAKAKKIDFNKFADFKEVDPATLVESLMGQLGGATGFPSMPSPY